MQKRYYSPESLEDELQAFEARYGIRSAQFYGDYRSGRLPAGMSQREAFAWADVYTELARLRERAPAVVAHS